MMSDNEINHKIATEVRGWTHVEGIIYENVNGGTEYLADYCNLVNYALDLAAVTNIGLKPMVEGWSGYSVANPDLTVIDYLPSKAICLCALAMVEQPTV